VSGNVAAAELVARFRLALYRDVAYDAIALAEGIGCTCEVALSLIMRGNVYEATGRDRGAAHHRARALLEDLGIVSLPRISG
jgi:hypothetical protein